jgi:hypothetical protein
MGGDMSESAGSERDRRTMRAASRRLRIPVLVALAVLPVALNSIGAARAGASSANVSKASTGLVAHSLIADSSAASSTIWLCRPGLRDDPCTSSLQTTMVKASGATSVVNFSPAKTSKFDCFYVYPTVSRELAPNADLRV